MRLVGRLGVLAILLVAGVAIVPPDRLPSSWASLWPWAKDAAVRPATPAPGAGGGGGGRRRRDGGGNGDPVAVLAATVQTMDVPVMLEGVGTARPAQTVTVRAQVDGQLLQILFQEGQDVRKGDILARIDKRTYQAQLDQAVAKKAQDEAQLDNARRDLERYVRLAETNSVTKQQADTQRAVVAQLTAQVAADQAAIDNARAILAYTDITAPIDGRTGIRNLDEGNLVKAADASGIVVISQIKPIAVLFSIPQQQLTRVARAQAQGAVSVEALGADNEAVLDRGSLQVIDNQVDTTTGTVRMKAEFPNAELALWPGAFVNVRLKVETLRQVLVVPTGAVQRGPQGPFVYVIKPDATVTVRPVTLTQQDDRQTVIASGVSQGERVVTTGFSRLAEGTAVSAPPAEAAPAGTPPPSAEATPGRPRGQRPDGAPRGERPPGERRGRPEGTPPAGAAQPGGQQRVEAGTPAPRPVP